jgi:ligand-binding sensor domain-containing protein
MMTFTKIVLLTCFTIFSSCNGQEKTNKDQVPNIAKPGPIIIKKFRTSTVAPDFDTTLVSQYIRSIFQDSKGNLWFGTINDGVVKYDKKTLTYFSYPDGFINTSVFAINEDKNGNFWFGTDQGLYKYDGKVFKNYSDHEGLNHIVISRKSILVDKSGIIWVGTDGGVYRYNPYADTTGGHCFSQFPLLSAMHVAGIMEDNGGNIWFATTDKGVFRYDGKLMVNFNEKKKLSENYAGGIAQDLKGNMWFTMKNGICKFDGKSFTAYTAKDGLGGIDFWGVFIEQSGIVWITARGSTTRFDPTIPLPNPKAFTVFTVAEGLNCCVQSMFQDKSGNMWWGTGNGLYRFDGKRFYQVNKKGPWY